MVKLRRFTAESASTETLSEGNGKCEFSWSKTTAPPQWVCR
jgi:hypothetical protein